MQIERSLLLKEDNNKVNICSKDCTHISKMIIDFIKDEYKNEFYMRYDYSDNPRIERCQLLDIKDYLIDAIKELEEDLDMTLK